MNLNRFTSYIGYLTVLSLLTVLGQPSYGQGVPSRIYVSDSPFGDTLNILVFDPETNTEVAAIPVADPPGELAASPDGTTLYTMVGNDPAVIDVLDNVVITTIGEVGSDLVSFFSHVVAHPDGSKVYVASTLTDFFLLQVTVIDTASNTVVDTITELILDDCHSPLGLAIHPDGSKLYTACRDVSDSEPDRFFLIDTATNTPTLASTFTMDSTNAFYINAMAVSPDGAEVYLARVDSTFGSEVLVFDGATGANVGTISLPADALPRAVAVTPDGSRLYVADIRLGTHVVGLSTISLISTALNYTNSRGFDIAMTPDGARVYVPLLFQISVSDTATNDRTATISGGSLNSAVNITISSPAGPLLDDDGRWGIERPRSVPQHASWGGGGCQRLCGIAVGCLRS